MRFTHGFTAGYYRSSLRDFKNAPAIFARIFPAVHPASIQSIPGQTGGAFS